jgi:hypothetical protein
MTASRTAYWREYNRKNAAKKREQGAAFRERNREKINADKRAARAAGKVAPRKVKAKVEEVGTLREKFAAFRAARAEGRE